MKLGITSPAPSCASDWSMDRPVAFKHGMKLGITSPAPSCASDWSMDRPVAFKHGMKLGITSPAPSCASDWSMDRPVAFKHGMKLGITSPAPSCASDWSMDRPVAFKHGMKLGITSPAPSCASDWSMDRPVAFKHGMKLGITSPAPSCASDWSMDRPVAFKHGVKLETASPAPTCALDATNNFVDRPNAFVHDELSACLLTEDHFRCPVCTDVLKEPVSIPCGHSYCKTCIQTYWNKPTHQGSYSCPQCRKMFKTRPALNPNSALAKVVQKLQQAGFSPAPPAHCYAGPEDVSCDFCTGRKLRAVKSCLTCSASYCEAHVKQHYTVPALQRHTLVDTTVDLEEWFCKLHHRALEVFCKTDQTFICFVCVMEEHKGHETVLSKSEDPTVEIPNSEQVVRTVQVPGYDSEKLEYGKSPLISSNLLKESKMEQQMMQLLKEFTARTERAESELGYLAERLCKDFVEVSALGRPLDLGMLYDCHSDSFSSGVFLWDVNTLSSMRLSLPQPNRDVRILEGKSLQDRLWALDLTTALSASVVSGLVEVDGAAAFLKHTTQSQLQGRVTLHYKTSTRLDMLSHRLLHNGGPLSMTSHSSATHVVVAVLYGAQAFFVLDEKSEHSEGSIKLKDEIKRNVNSQSVDELLLNLEQADCFFGCALYTDGEDFKSSVDFNTAVKRFRSLYELLEPESERAVPLKAWLYPLKNLKLTSACVVGNISEGLLKNAVEVLEHLEKNINISQDMMSIYSTLGVTAWYPGLKEALFEYSSLLQKYQSVFQEGLASCIKTVREIGEDGKQNLRDLLKRNAESPFSPQNMHQWLLNKDAKVVALNDCRSANITVLKSQKDLQRVVEDPEADRVLCFTFTSLEGEDLFLSALKQHIDLVTSLNTQEVQPPFRLPDISQKILNGLHLFLSSREKNEDVEHTKFIAASIPQLHVHECSVCLYQFGNIVSSNVQLELKPESPEIINIKQTCVSLRLQRSKSSVVQRYRVEYRAVSCGGNSRVYVKWSDIDITSTEESYVIRGLKPETQYQLRYAVMDSNSMSDFSRITEFQTPPRSRPGRPTVLKQNTDSLTVTWQSAEADGDSPVLRYMVEYMEAGLEGWQSVLTEGPECEYTITLPYSTCYRVRVSAVCGEGDTSKPSEETEVPLKTWIINLSKRKSSLFLEVLKLQTVKKPVELRGCSDEESEVRSFLQCLPYISQLRFRSAQGESDEWRKRVKSFLLDLCLQAALHQKEEIHTTVEKLISCARCEEDDFLLDLFSHVKKYETETGRSVLPALQPVYQSAPAVWIINLSEGKSSLLLEVLKLQTEKKPVELRGWSDEESEVRSFLQCLPYISQLRFGYWGEVDLQFVVKLIAAAAECDSTTGENFTKLLTSVCSYTSFPYREIYEEHYDFYSYQSDLLLNLFSHVKKYETETGRSVLPALQSVYQSVPAVWSINLLERKSSLLLEVLKLQTVKKPVELRGCSDEESEVRSFLQCLPYISQLSFDSCEEAVLQLVVKLIAAAAECDSTTGENLTKLLTSVCSYTTFPYREIHEEDDDFYSVQSDFLLDLFSHVKKYETETGRSVLPALQPVYQSAPAVWIIDLSERKSSLLLEVLKLQTVKKPVELRGCSDEESEVRSFLQCLPYISQLSFGYWGEAEQFVVKLIAAAAECDSTTGENFTKLLTSVCSYTTFPYREIYEENDDFYSKQSDFLLDLFSHVKKYETETGRSVLPALQPVYQSAPAVWSIDLSERKSSLLLEVLKLQSVKKPVELWGCSDEESEVRSFLQCLPYISQLRDADQFVPSLCKALQSATDTELMTLLLQALDFTLSLEGKLPTSCCRAVGRVLQRSASKLNLTLNPQAISLRGTRCLFRHITHLRTLKLSAGMVVKVERALRAVRAPAPVTIEELSLIQSRTTWTGDKLSRVLSSLASLLRVWNVQCLNLTEHTIEAQSLTVLLCLQDHLTIRVSKETLLQLVFLVYEAQEGEFTRSFLQKVGGDLSSCSLQWKVIQYFLQYHTVTVDVRKSSIKQQNIRELLTVLDRVQLRRLNSSFLLSIIREIYETGSAHCVSSLLSSTENCINLNSRELDTVHCAALRFTLQHCRTVSLSLLWASIPEGELESIVPLLNHVSHLSVDRLLLLRLIHCCSVQQGAAAALLSALQHRLDLSCSFAMDLAEHTQTHTLSTKDCRVISMVIQRAPTHTQLILQDCEMEEAAVEQLFSVLHTVRLRCSKALLLQFLALVHVGTELECVRRAASLSLALGEELDLSQTRLDLQACRSLALFLEHSEGLSELDLGHCQITDHCLELLLPHLHKTCILDLSHNDITDVSAKRIYHVVSVSSNTQTVRLFNNRITDRQLFLSDRRFEIW
ncbi:uncharacterized protein [Salminus brasiliensis]|uniref:uncharacterized protein n=1 Tax=Salminus brasiliensis TaxID=930266 RepID=UPI003B82FD9A